ncbi:MAG: efflux transporter outer membrane subunit [Hydrogenophaga sp.]|jgi:multidrug efflux system outer membrane protein|nr:efflux transporter outer membrane subunit [Hydrogenophaga sp.]
MSAEHDLNPGLPRGRLVPMALALVVLLSACSFAPVYERPEAPVPSRFADDTAAATASGLPSWSEFVGDARLRELIRLSLANNRDLRLALANVDLVRAQFRIQRANELPTVNVGATGSRQSREGGDIASAYTAGLMVSAWEVDFFGRLASLSDAALAQFFASEEAARAAQTSLVAAVASTWLSLQVDDELLTLTRSTLQTREDALRLTRLRFDNGAASALDVRQAESLTATARATLAQQQRQRTQRLNALTLLAGQAVPESLLPAPTAPSSPAPLAEVPAGLPSDLLERRPDIRQAEQQLKAANANIGAARAAFFPRISLTASLGSASTELSGLFRDGSWGFSLAPQAMLPIFDLGRNQAALDASKVSRDAAVTQYEKAIQTAFREVSDALAGRATLNDQLAAQEALVQAEAERLRLADLRYRNGVASFLDVLDAQRSLFAARQALSQTRLARQLNQVDLYRALGGGWSPDAQVQRDSPAGRS